MLLLAISSPPTASVLISSAPTASVAMSAVPTPAVAMSNSGLDLAVDDVVRKDGVAPVQCHGATREREEKRQVADDVGPDVVPDAHSDVLTSLCPPPRGCGIVS